MHNPVSRIMFSTSAKPQRPSSRKRSTSMTDLKYVKDNNAITRPAATGAGLKARRMSTCLPDDFDVETVELKEEFASTSVVPGRRGKTVGIGATATVKLMIRKSGPPDVIFAVKEFRKRSKHEDETEYVKKVKSEYAIAKSLRHPNIVETVRLCTHSGRWNHVMEYCAQGDLHTLVSKGYLKDADHLCLFKQLLRGVAYLHGHGIAHRDIKLQNLLMTNQGQLKITDFGVSEVFSGEHPGLRGVGLECGKNMKETRRCAPGICGSRPYIAPEVLSKKGQSLLSSKNHSYLRLT
jgi:protein-serine/threonine kinase